MVYSNRGCTHTLSLGQTHRVQLLRKNMNLQVLNWLLDTWGISHLFVLSKFYLVKAIRWVGPHRFGPKELPFWWMEFNFNEKKQMQEKKIKKGRTETEIKLTWWGSEISIKDESWIMEITGTMKAYEPPTTVGNRVPNRVCRSVLIPSTKSRVCTTLTLSSWSHSSN